MNIKRELNAYSVKIQSAAEQMREAERDYIDLAFKHRKEYELPLPEDCECESWEEYVETEDFDYSTLPCYTNIWDHHGGCHEVYITSVYKGTYGFEVCGYDLTDGEYVCGWDADSYGDIIDFIQAVLAHEEDDRHFATITYDGKEYWLRQVLSNEGTLLIGDTKLYDALHPGSFEDADGGWASKEAERIDEDIFYYVSPDELLLPKEELIAVLKESNPDLFE